MVEINLTARAYAVVSVSIKEKSVFMRRQNGK